MPRRARSFDARWFAGSGLAVVLIGVLTLLATPPSAPAVRWAAVGANVAGLVLAVAFGALTRWRAPQGPVLVTLFLAGAVGAMSHPGSSRDLITAPGPGLNPMAAAPNSERTIRLRVRVAEAPPRACAGYAEIEGGLQRKAEVLPGEAGPDGLPRFACELRARRDAATGAPVFHGPFAFGPPSARFLYVSWSAVRPAAPAVGRAMFRRAKVPLGGITWTQVEEAAARPGAALEATVPGVARDGGPVCASVPPREGWRVVAS